jgi:hypothetical protein
MELYEKLINIPKCKITKQAQVYVCAVHKGTISSWLLSIRALYSSCVRSCCSETLDFILSSFEYCPFEATELDNVMLKEGGYQECN